MRCLLLTSVGNRKKKTEGLARMCAANWSTKWYHHRGKQCGLIFKLEQNYICSSYIIDMHQEI